MGFIMEMFERPLQTEVNRKPPDPPPVIVMPAAAEAPKAADPIAPEAVAEAVKKKQRGAQGMSEDKKTGPQGLGEVPKANQERKQLLGY